jgi:hypothetical protein
MKPEEQKRMIEDFKNFLVDVLFAFLFLGLPFAMRQNDLLSWWLGIGISFSVGYIAHQIRPK